MKKIITIIASITASISSCFAQTDIDLIPTGLNFNYDFQTAILSNLTFSVQNVGSESTEEGEHWCKVYLVDIASGQWLIGEAYTDEFGIADNSSEVMTMPSVDLDTISGLNTGNYYIKIVVDFDDIEEEDNESNNTVTFASLIIEFEKIATSIKKMENSSVLNVFPNPASSILNIDIDGIDFKVDVTNLFGQVVISTVNTKQIDVSLLPKGIYNVILTNDKKEKYTSRLIKN